MNMDRIKYLAPIFAALAEGKDVQWKYRSEVVWNKAVSGNFNFEADAEWRVTPPPPKDYWIVTGEGKDVHDRGTVVCNSLQQAERLCEGTTFRMIHVREVVE